MPQSHKSSICRCEQVSWIFCELCSKLILNDEFYFQNGEKFILHSKVDCNAKFCIYLLQCSCKKIYIGECEDFRARINLHTNQIKKKEYRNLFVSKHIFQCGQKFQCAPFFLMKNKNLIERKVREEFFINKFKPELNC